MTPNGGPGNFDPFCKEPAFFEPFKAPVGPPKNLDPTFKTFFQWPQKGPNLKFGLEIEWVPLRENNF